jgi:hypothetical protein
MDWKRIFLKKSTFNFRKTIASLLGERFRNSQDMIAGPTGYELDLAEWIQQGIDEGFIQIQTYTPPVLANNSLLYSSGGQVTADPVKLNYNGTTVNLDTNLTVQDQAQFNENLTVDKRITSKQDLYIDGPDTNANHTFASFDTGSGKVNGGIMTIYRDQDPALPPGPNDGYKFNIDSGNLRMSLKSPNGIYMNEGEAFFKSNSFRIELPGAAGLRLTSNVQATVTGDNLTNTVNNAISVDSYGLNRGNPLIFTVSGSAPANQWDNFYEFTTPKTGSSTGTFMRFSNQARSLNYLEVKNNGNIGVNNPNPSSKLDVKGSFIAQEQSGTVNNFIAVNASAAGLEANDTATNRDSKILAYANEAIISNAGPGSSFREIKVDTHIKLTGIPSAFSDSAAAADASIPSGAIYRVGNNLKIKL